MFGSYLLLLRARQLLVMSKTQAHSPRNSRRDGGTGEKNLALKTKPKTHCQRSSPKAVPEPHPEEKQMRGNPELGPTFDKIEKYPSNPLTPPPPAVTAAGRQEELSLDPRPPLDGAMLALCRPDPAPSRGDHPPEEESWSSRCLSVDSGKAFLLENHCCSAADRVS